MAPTTRRAARAKQSHVPDNSTGVTSTADLEKSVKGFEQTLTEYRARYGNPDTTYTGFDDKQVQSEQLSQAMLGLTNSLGVFVETMTWADCQQFEKALSLVPDVERWVATEGAGTTVEEVVDTASRIANSKAIWKNDDGSIDPQFKSDAIEAAINDLVHAGGTIVVERPEDKEAQ